MGELTSYAIEVAIVLIVEYLVYKLTFAGTTLYRFNRLVIMCCYILSLVAVPMIHWLAGMQSYGVVDGAVDIEAPMAVVAHTGESSNVWAAVPLLYMAGVVVMLIVTCISYARLAHIIRTGQRRDYDEYTLVVIDKEISPFSWGKFIIVAVSDAENNMIVTHELAHIRNRHIYDLFLAQMFVIFNWFNPAAYLMRDELRAVQEYEADEQVLASGADAREYQMLLIKKTVGAGFQAIANSLNHSQLKNRLTMMLKTKSKSARRLMAAVMLPAVVLAASLTDIPAVAGVLSNVGAVSYSKSSENLSDSQTLAQNPESAAVNKQAAQDKVYENPEVLPKFKGGEAEMYWTLAENTHYPKDAAQAKAQGRCVIQFVVNADGTISDVSVNKSSGNTSLDAEAVRVVKESLSTGWTPGKENGKAVACKYVLGTLANVRG